MKAGSYCIHGRQEVQQDIENRLEELRRLEADLFDLQSQIELLEVRAPMDSIVASIEKQPDNLYIREWFGYIYNTSDMRLWGQVDDVDVLLVQQGARYKLRWMPFQAKF